VRLMTKVQILYVRGMTLQRAYAFEANTLMPSFGFYDYRFSAGPQPFFAQARYPLQLQASLLYEERQLSSRLFLHRWTSTSADCLSSWILFCKLFIVHFKTTNTQK
jgi:hypothetical protein